MRISCLINCFNYGRFVGDAIRSALAQTRSFDEIIVVDDCSTDDSREVIAQIAGENPGLVILHHQRNSGQLAAFESGINASTGDVLCFLDADDVFSRDYVSSIASAFESDNSCDFLICGAVEFGTTGELRFEARDVDLRPQPLGRSAIWTAFGRPTPYVGANTSRLSMRRAVATALFPVPCPGDWRICADDCLVYGSSILGVRKFELSEKLVGYRVHEANAHYGAVSKRPRDEMFRRQFARARVISHYTRKFCVDEGVARLAYLEFRTIPKPTFAQFLAYAGIALRKGTPPGTSRARAMAVMAKYWLAGGAGDSD